MPKSVLVLIGCVILGMGIWGLVTGKVVAGSRGLRANYYERAEVPLLYFCFVFVYSAIGGFVLWNALN